MTQSDREQRRYCKLVWALLPCSRKQKNEILQQLRESLTAYQAEHPDADFRQLRAHFGSPESVAAACVESAGTAEILHALRIRKRIVMLIASVLIAALLLWASALSIIVYQNGRAGADFAVVEITELPEGTVVEDDSIRFPAGTLIENGAFVPDHPG